MAKTSSSAQKLNRGSDMDQALFEALASNIPPKDTGPDPDDILADVFDDEIDPSSKQHVGDRDIVVALDGIDAKNARQIMELVRNQTGEQIDLAGAIKISLALCAMDEQEIGVAYQGITARKRRD